MNSTSTAKYSIETLPGDSWEVRRAKQVARAIVRAKNGRDLTTEALATKCSRILGVPDSVKPSTLNGLFGGKRRTISTAEIEMFAQALSVPVPDLLYPQGETVEVRPGKVMNSADALLESLGVTFDLRTVINEPFFIEGRVGVLIRAARAGSRLQDAVVTVIGMIRRLGPEFSDIGPRVELARYALADYKSAISLLDRKFHEAPPKSWAANWAIETDDAAISAEFILALEPSLAGIEVGKYRLGSFKESDGEHQETP